MLEAIRKRLEEFVEEYSEQPLGTLNAIKRIHFDGSLLEISIVFGYPCERAKPEIVQSITNWLSPSFPEIKIKVDVSSQIEAHSGRGGMATLPEVKNIIAVASGKGGVGKSTIAINVALALAKEGANVGILDADIYGPSQPTLLGTVKERPVLKASTLQPVVANGLQSMSIGYLVDQDAPMVWRGPMIGKAMQQLLHDTAWHNLDYLVIDLPPGTGDIQLTLCQKIPVSGALMVTTPQDLALIDVVRACEMFKKLNVPLLGIVENMSHYVCHHCGTSAPIFGTGGGVKLADQQQISLLGSIPLNARLREMTDTATSPILNDPDSEEALIFAKIARKVSAKLALQLKDQSRRFPKIVIAK